MRGGVQVGAPSPCLWCRKPTRSPNRVCGEVCRTTARLADRVPDDTEALPEGDWVLDTTTRVLRWEPRYWAS